MAEEFFSDLRSMQRRKQSTIRGYQNALRLFCSYVSHPDYGWDRVCEQRFGAHPAQVFFEWNTAAHVQDNEQSPAKRAFTKRELQDFFGQVQGRGVRRRRVILRVDGSGGQCRRGVLLFRGGVVVGAGFAEDVEAEVAPGLGPFVVLFGQHRPDEADQGARSGKIPTTSVRRRISLLSRSWGLLDLCG